MICGAMQLQAMRVSGLNSAPCCGRRCLERYYLSSRMTAVSVLDLKISKEEEGGAGRGGKDGREKENLFRD